MKQLYRRVLAICAVAIVISSCGGSADNATSPDPAALIVAAYQKQFGFAVPRPPIVRTGADFYTSVIYIGNQVFRIYLDRDLKITSSSYTVKRPAGTFRVLVIALDYGNTNIATVFDSAWPAAQNEINGLHSSYAAKLGLRSPIVQFANMNLLANSSEIVPPRGRNEVMTYLSSKGLFPVRDFDIAVLLDLDPSSVNPVLGGYADGEFVYMNCNSCPTVPMTFQAGHFRGFAHVVYNHEIGHIWGWEHEWHGDVCMIDRSSSGVCSGFITAPELFGWTDTDDDVIPEILDSKPYGMR